VRPQLEQRLRELQAEYERGSRILVDLQEREARCRESLLRLSGAIHVLEEVLGQEKTDDLALEQVS
jgi:hypothetical protein